MKQMFKDEILLDVLMQSCTDENSLIIDNMCISCYENACEYLKKRGYLKAINPRIYKLTKYGKKLLKIE